MMTQDSSTQSLQQNSQPDASASDLPIRTSANWETPDVEELDLCLEVTAYVQQWK